MPSPLRRWAASVVVGGRGTESVHVPEGRWGGGLVEVQRRTTFVTPRTPTPPSRSVVARHQPALRLFHVVIVVVEELDVTRHHPAEGLDRVLDPVDIGCHGYALPALQVAGPEPRVRPECTGGVRLEV